MAMNKIQFQPGMSFPILLATLALKNSVQKLWKKPAGSNVLFAQHAKARNTILPGTIKLKHYSVLAATRKQH